MNRASLLIAVAVACFVIDFLLAVAAIDGGNFDAWLSGGLIAFTAAHLP